MNESDHIGEVIEHAEELIQNNPRSLGYITSAETKKIIKNLKNHGIWDLLYQDEIVQYFRRISEAFKVNVRSLRHWHNMLKKDREWLPLHIKNPSTAGVFTEQQLDNLARIIFKIADSQNVIITNQLVKNLSLAYYKSLNYHPQPNLQFAASSHFIRKLKKRFRFSTRRLHPKRRPTAKKETVQSFLLKAKKIFRKADHSHVVNADETFIRCEEYHLRTWAAINSQNIILHTNGSNKAGFTAVATISLDGHMHPMILIAKGKTQQVENSWFGAGRSLNFNFIKEPEPLKNPYFMTTSSRRCTIEKVIPTSLTDHSPKGWTNISTWKNYLKTLRYRFIKPLPPPVPFYDTRNRIYLFIDSYRVHKCPEIIDFATELNIDITVIPEGMTETHQPLDNKLFGILKAKISTRIKEILSIQLNLHEQ